MSTNRYQRTSDGGVVGIFVALQAFVAIVSVVLLYFQGMGIAGCGVRCDYAGAYAANVTLWVASPLILAATLVILVLLRQRRWRNWPIVLLSTLCTIAVACIAFAMLNSAISG